MALWQRWQARPPRRLQLCESLPLGEKRFLAVVRVDAQRFLIGGTGNSIALLATLSGPAGHGEGAENE